MIEQRRLVHHQEKDLTDAFHVYYTNLEVHHYNESKLNQLNETLFEISVISTFPQFYKPKISEFGTIDATGFMKNLCLKVGARVMVIHNINVSDSLVNGSIGIIIDIVTKPDGKDGIDCIMVKFENEDAGKEQRRMYPYYSLKYESQNGVPIFREALRYKLPYKGKSKKVHGATGEIRQFPLRLAWASTCHKLQGTTIPNGCKLVCHGYPRMPAHMPYVMLSRCTNIENIFIDETFSTEKFVCKRKCMELEAKEELEKKCIVASRLEKRYSLVMINIRSLRKHFEDVKKDPILQRADCIALTETWMYEDSADEFMLEDKTMFHSSHGKGKGCVLYAESTKIKFVGKFCMEKFQILSVIYNKNIQITLMYLSQGNQDNHEVIEFLEMVLDDKYEQIVVGDFNFDAEEDSELGDFFMERGLTQEVKKPTHLLGNTLDHCYKSSNIANFKVELFSPYYTDHSGLCLTFD